VRFDAVFFDSGGTLYRDAGTRDPSRSEVSAGRFRRLAAALTGFDVEMDGQELEEAVVTCEQEARERLGSGYNYARLMEALNEHLAFGLRREEAACLADAYAGPRYAHWLYPGTVETIRTLTERGYYLGIIANTHWPGFSMDRAFDAVGLLPYFRTRVYSGDIGIAKPDPAIFRYAEETANLARKSILYVGNDLSADVHGAKGVGWQVAFRKAEGKTSNRVADFEYDETAELLEFVT
jgi:HAD superfamily hydrolase (TIGR01549 family)